MTNYGLYKSGNTNLNERVIKQLEKLPWKIGEKAGDNLKFWVDGDYDKLPNSGIEIQDAKYEHDWQNKFTIGKTFWLNAIYGVPARNLDVDKEIQLSFEDYLNGKDAILEWILNDAK